MIITCSVPFSTTSYIQCAAPTLSDATSNENFSVCTAPYQLGNGYLICNGIKDTTTDLTTGAYDNYYVATTDNVSTTGNYVTLPTSQLTSISVADYISSVASPDSDDSETGSTTLTAADYSALLSLAIPSLVIAWSFKILVRQILNR